MSGIYFRARTLVVLFAASLAVFEVVGLTSGGSSEAKESAAGAQYSSGDNEIEAARDQVESKDEELRSKRGEISSVGEDLDDSQSFLDAASRRTGELRGEARDLQRELAQRKAARREAHRRYQEGVVAAYKGEGVRGVDLLLEGLVGDGTVRGSGIEQVLSEGRKTLQQYQRAEQMVRDMERQVSTKNEAYAGAAKEEEQRAAELRRQKQRLEAEATNIQNDRKLSKILLQRLRSEERRRILRSDPATGGSAGRKGYEMRLARRKITARKVDPISKKEYLRLYKKSAREYGFAGDWQILAAVGEVESNHGENMGPSSAGALGPMQFLPSTWVEAGVDGDGDGEANIMDPEDAIPAAAKYLKAGGAPRDWHAALYSYNHAEWYVVKVLSVAEGYRRLPE